MHVIEINNLTKTYGNARGITGVSFHVEEGEIFNELLATMPKSLQEIFGTGTFDLIYLLQADILGCLISI
ncbi:hypothetical protein [Psychrobacillus sp.]|uniref:hypothetical protein n=1 Tax=Psychrobacillus sp. TaxID=1871623 RepID=UPI0028BDD9EC|nr:hypothetical protein [Psychrobacillus sp.]